MNKYLAAVIGLLLVLLNGISLSAAEQRVVRVGAFNYYPAIFQDSDGVVKGFYVDALADLGRRENIRFEYVFGSWSEGLARIQTGEVDLLTSVAYTDDRAKFLDYGKTPLLTVWGELYVPLASDIDGIRGVQGKKIAVMKGDFNARHFIELVKKFDITCDFVELDGFERVFKEIAAKKVDAGVVNSTFGVAKQHEFGLRSTGIVFNPFDIYFAVAKGKNQGLRALLDRYLVKWRHQADSPFTKARQKWSHGTTGMIQHIPGWLVNSFAALIVLAFGSGVFILLLKKQVQSKTRSIGESSHKYQILSARQEALLAAVPDIIMEADTKRVYTWANSAGREFFGDDVVGKEYAYYFEREQNTIEIVKPLYDGTEKLLYVESWQRRKDGEVRLLAWWCKALVDEHGVVTGTLSTARDITEQKQSELTLRESEQKTSEALEFNRSILKTSSIGIVLYRADGQCYFANEAAAVIIGSDVRSLLAQNFHQISSWRESGIYETALKALNSEDEQIQEVSVVTTFGKSLWLRLIFSAIPAKDEKHLLLFTQDITQRKNSEMALQQRLVALTQPLDSGSVAFEELFSIADVQRLQDEFARATGVASIITHPDGTPLTAPSNFTRLCEDIIRTTEKGRAACFKSDAFLGRFNPDGPIIQPCLSGGLWDAGAGIAVGGQHIANWLIGQVRDETQSDEKMSAYAREIGVDEAAFLQAFHETPAMSRVQFEQIAQFLFTLANQLSASAYQNTQQARFINDRNQAEEEKAKLESQLLQAQKMESVGRLAGGVAHDFNNMLTVIIGQAELGLMKIGPSDPLAGNFAEIIAMAERSAELIRQLLAFARKQTVAPKVLDLNVTVTATLKMLQRLIGENIRLVWQPAPDLGRILMDPTQLDQVLANLCVNARDAIEDTGMISIETENRTIDSDFRNTFLDSAPGEYVRLSVRDNGRGMDKEIISQIFEPFFTTKEMGKGTGLGLSTVYGIVKQNNGFVDVCSEPEHGTVFSIYLPRYDGKCSQVLPGGFAVPVPRGQETILVVEDETSILDIVSIMLKGQGYSVLAASTPGEAIKLAREFDGEIQLLMTDVVMPEMNGRDLAKNLLSMYPHLKRLFMSGYTANVIAHHGVLDEGVHFIQKPFSLPAMAAKVREVLDSAPTQLRTAADRSRSAVIIPVE